MRQFFNFISRNKSTAILFAGFWGAEFVWLIFLGLFNDFFLVDEMEHIHASWLVADGNVPYRDFFEHHHPLLWFIFSPFTLLFYDNANILLFSHYFALFFNLISLFYVYRICKLYISDVWTWVLCLITIAVFNDKMHALSVEFRPDLLMHLCFLSGLYYYFSYLKDKKTYLLTLAFCLFALSFLFLQKIIFLLLVLGGWTLFLVGKKVISLSDFFKSLILPVVILLSFLGYLFFTDSLKQYWELNYTLNTLLSAIYGFSCFRYKLGGIALSFSLNNQYFAVNFSWFDTLISFIALFCLSAFIKPKNVYRRTFALLFVFELIIRYFTFSTFAQYFYLLNILALVIIFSVLEQQKSKLWLKVRYVFVFGYILAFLNAVPDYIFRKSPVVEKIKEYQYIIDNTSDDEKLLNGYINNFNIFRKDTDYVWFALNDAGYLYNSYLRKDRYDINADILADKPKFIYFSNFKITPLVFRSKFISRYNFDILNLYKKYPDKYLDVSQVVIQNKALETQKISQELIDKYYEPTMFDKLYIRKNN